MRTWLNAIEWFQARDRGLTQEWPPELPPESAPGFWERAAKLEMEGRTLISRKIERWIEAPKEPCAMTPLETWLYRRRVEWAGQVIVEKAAEGAAPEAPLAEVLKWLLVESWESDGCIAFWTHGVERGGQPPA